MLLSRNLKVVLHFRFSFFQCHRKLSNLKILFFGTDNFSLNSLKKLSSENPLRLEVVTSFRATKNPVKAYAEKNLNLKTIDWSFLTKDENYKLCSEFDIGLVVSFGHKIPESIISSFRHGMMLNVHASLLPQYRGASPIIYAIKNGEKETGVSIMKIHPKAFDVGPVLAQRKTPISEDESMLQLHERLSLIGADLLVDVVKSLEKYQPIEQDNTKASYAPKIDNEFCKIRWEQMSSVEIFNTFRSIYSFKHLLTSFKNENVKIIEMSKVTDDLQTESQQPPGHLRYCNKLKKLFVKCSDDKYLEIQQITIGKKKPMRGEDFNNGFLKKCNENERCFK